MRKRPITLITILIIVLLFFDLFWIRALSPREIDDISPEIQCEDEYIKKSNILWIIPKYNNKSISENKEWCDYISGLNKTLGLHGVYHTFNEFEEERDRRNLKIHRIVMRISHSFFY